MQGIRFPCDYCILRRHETMAENTNSKRDVVQRHQFADVLNIGTSEKAKWVLMGVGFTTLD